MPIPSANLERPRLAAQRWPRGAAAAVLLAAAAATGGGVLLGNWLEDGALAWRTAGLTLGGGAVLLWLAARRLAAPRFGVANVVTLTRAALVLLLLALLGVAASTTVAWLLVALSAVAAALDSIDGAIARGRSETSAFGARFDMEIDALFILTLAMLLWQHDKAGSWILLAGLLRYLFVATSWALPWLGAALPPSRRRQAVCVAQIVSLIGALVPLIEPPWSGALGLAGLVALVWSFGVDVAWLARHARS